MKIAMWSGPRNLSTAMMYSFGNRADLQVWDEPFYAAYLNDTGIDHPMREGVLAAVETDPIKVERRILNTGGNLFLKLMTFHMEQSYPWRWAEDCVHFHLLRHPARVIASYTAKREKPTLLDIGFEQQAEIYARFPGPVVMSSDIRKNPETMLKKLCAEIGLGFDAAMLDWPSGPKPFDGPWAPHWYDTVHKSTGFASEEGPLPELTGETVQLLKAALPFYEALADRRI